MLVNYVRRSAYHTLCYGAASLVSRVIAFIFLPYFLSHLTLEEFGMWDFYQTFFSFGTLVLSSCAATALTRFYIVSSDDPLAQEQALSNALWGVLIGTIIFACIVPTSVSFFSASTSYVYITTLNVCLFSLFAMVLVYQRVTHALRAYFFCFCGQAIAAVVGTVYGVHNGWGIVSFFYANALSYVVFVPLFLQLCWRYRTWSWSLFKHQVAYSGPLFINALLYNGFFMLDRFWITYALGYEGLGEYGLLWRFGGIFQFFATALMDARVIVLFGAHKEEKGDQLIKKLTTYFCLLLGSGVVASIVLSHWAIGCFFPTQYQHIISYLPLFFLALGILEIGRVMGAGFSLAGHTTYAPLLVIVGLVVQGAFLFCSDSLSIWGAILGHIAAFIVYGLTNYWYTIMVYPGVIIDILVVGKMMSCLVGCAALLHVMVMYSMRWYFPVSILAMWPFLVWRYIITRDEKEWANTHMHKGARLVIDGWAIRKALVGKKLGW